MTKARKLMKELIKYLPGQLICQNTNKSSVELQYNCNKILPTTSNQVDRSFSHLCKSTHFTSSEIRNLVLLYQHLIENIVTSPMSEDIFYTFLTSQFDITNSIALECIFRSFKSTSRSRDINIEEFLIGLSIFLRGNLLERAMFCFKAYDLDGDGCIRRKEEISKFLMSSFDPKSEAVLTEIDSEEPIRETINYLWQKFVPLAKQTITLTNYLNTVRKEPILMECLCSIFPSDSKILTFQRMLFCNCYIVSYLTSKK